MGYIIFCGGSRLGRFGVINVITPDKALRHRRLTNDAIFRATVISVIPGRFKSPITLYASTLYMPMTLP